MKDNYNWLDVANWTALRLREMHKPIKEGLFMEGGLTPHQYLTKEIEGLIEIEKLSAEIGELELLVVQQIDVGKLVPLSVIIDRKADLTEKLKELENQLKQENSNG